MEWKTTSYKANGDLVQMDRNMNSEHNMEVS